MKLIHKLNSRKYLKRMLISIFLVIMSSLIFCSFTVYYYAEKNVLDVQYDANKKVLSQINYNINYMNEMIKNLALSTYFDPTTVSMLYSRDTDLLRDVATLNKFDKTVNATSFLHSVMIYNTYTGQYYTTEDNPDKGALPILKETIRQQDGLPKLRFIPLHAAGNGALASIFAYAICESARCSLSGESALVFMIKSEWLLTNIKAVNRIADPSTSIYIVDKNGQYVDAIDDQLSLPADALRQIALDRSSDAADVDSIRYMTENVGGRKSFITYMNTVNDWKVISIQPYDTVLHKLNRIRWLIFAVTGVILFLSMVVSVMISLKLYNPIDRLFAMFRESNQDTATNEHDELSYMSKAYLQVSDRYKMAQRNVAKEYQLRKIVLASSSITEAEWPRTIDESGLRLNPAGPFMIAVLKIDNYRTFNESPAYADKHLFRFAIANIAQDIIGHRCRAEIADMRNDHLVIVSSWNGTDYPADPMLAAFMREIQEAVHGYYRLSLTVSISDVFTDYHAITAQYERALQQSLYRLVLGKGAVITSAVVSANASNVGAALSPQWVERLEADLNTSDYGRLEADLMVVLNELIAFSYHNIIHTIMNIVFVLSAGLEKINRNRIQPLQVDMKLLMQRVLEMETLEEIKEEFRGLCLELNAQTKNQESVKRHALLDVVKQVVEEHYADPLLSLQFIASQLKMSPVYLGQLFKKYENRSISEFITDVRMKHAVELLENRSYSIKELMEKVGFGNESHFYKMFKKQFGVTPKEYRLRKSLDK